MTTEFWVTQRRAAEDLGVSERTLHRWRKVGLLKPGQDYCRQFPYYGNSPVLYRVGLASDAVRGQ